MKTPICPFIKEECMEHRCMLYTHVQMTDPQTGKDRDEWACSLALIPIMVVENARCTRGVQASVESMRNEVIERQDLLNRAVLLAQSSPPKTKPAAIVDERETELQCTPSRREIHGQPDTDR